MEFELNYIKDNIPESLSDFLNVSNIQNYNPLYKLFFKLNENNYNQIQLNEKLKLKGIQERITHNQFKCVLQDSNKTINKQMFIKFSPIIDPTKYMIGKYDLSDNDLFDVPSLLCVKDDTITAKKNNHFNSAYTDGFFSFLSSKLLHNHNVENANDYYGSFTGNQNDFRFNVYDDIDYLCESDFFHANKNVLFDLDESFDAEYDNSGSRDNKKKIKIDTNKLSLKSVEQFNDNIYDNIFTSSMTNVDSINVNENVDDFLLEKIEFSHPVINLKNNHSRTNSSHSSSCSSRTSITDNNEDISIGDLESLEDMSSCSSECSNENIYAHIRNFPVNIIALEMCDNTLDDYIMNEDVSDKEWAALLLQVIFTLLIYQKTFQFTHNDLHSNNIMYVKTEKQFLFYNFNSKYYKIPTYGKIWKIIDFGRAIYKYKNTTICSDCFDKNEDADGQYNCEPFFNNSKPRLEPNNSFDLCRLGCSLFDFFIDDVTNFKRSKLSSIEKIVVDWCYDDNNKNILYKKNGEERYPEFKLYKMIARTVHKHTPENQLDHDVFSAFQLSKKKLNHSQVKKVLYINDLPNYT
jgi:hypothetical protein